MLAALSIRDIVLVDRLDIAFALGLTVLTGETGAGKSILLDALALALGGRGDGALVRHGASQGQVVAEFDLPEKHPVRALLAESGIDVEGDLILRRVQNADGRSRAFIDDQPVSVSLLQQVGRLLVEIHGQHADRALVDPASHRRLLDAFGRLEAEARAVAEAWRARRAAERDLSEHRTRLERARAERDYLTACLEELDRLAPSPGEEAELAARRHAMMQGEKIAGDLSDALEVLSGSDSPIAVSAGLLRRLERKSAHLPGLLAGVVKPLAAGIDALEEARAALEAAFRATEFDPRELERTEERLFALRAAARKHGVAVDDLAVLRERFSADLAALEEGEGRLQALEAAAQAAAMVYREAARRLSERRAAAARALEAAVAAELPALRLERARFLVEIATDPDLSGPDGSDTVEFWVRTNPGTRPGPMMKVASGGELARFLLALKVTLADRGSAPTLVFDEIDTGVGGAVAEAIGIRLARLARRVQVLAVTHAPQVAARADSHLLIRKEAIGPERVATRVDELASPARREEIARMLAGETITSEARAAAERLLADAVG